MRYSNLDLMMTKRGVQHQQIAEVLGISPRTLYNKMMGRTQFTVDEASQIHKHFFPDVDFWTLFDTSEEKAPAAPYLGEGWERLTVLDLNSGKEIAVITNELITTADQGIVIQLTPRGA